MSNNVSTDVVAAKNVQLRFGSSSISFDISLCLYMGVGIGGVEWPAACLFCHVLANNPAFYKDLFVGKKILELGAGTGMGGIAVDKICGVDASKSEVLITDLKQYLTHLEQNVEMNNAARSCHVEALDWLNLPDFVSKRPTSHKFDIILALECVYREDLYQPLIDTILCTSTKNTLIFLGLTRLFAKTVFFDLLHQNGIYYTKLPEHSVPREIRKESSTADCGILLLYFPQ